MGQLQQTLSAQEFTQWIEYLQAEQIGPDWEARRHAELLAAAHNGAMVKADKKPFTALDFMRRDPWAPPEAAPQRFLNPLDEQLSSAFGWPAHE